MTFIGIQIFQFKMIGGGCIWEGGGVYGLWGYRVCYDVIYFLNTNSLFLEYVYCRNKPATLAAHMPLPGATPPTGKINQFSKIVLSFEQIMQF